LLVHEVRIIHELIRGTKGVKSPIEASSDSWSTTVISEVKRVELRYVILRLPLSCRVKHVLLFENKMLAKIYEYRRMKQTI
jgi:hypothetical protein